MWEKKMTAAVCIAMVTGGTACLDLRPSTESTKRAKSLKREHSDSVLQASLSLSLSFALSRSLSHTRAHTLHSLKISSLI